MKNRATHDEHLGLEPASSRIEYPFREIFENAPFGMCISCLDKSFQHANGALCRMLGYSAKELRGAQWTELIHPDDLEFSREKMDHILAGSDDDQQLEKRFVRRDGSIVWARIRIVLVRDSSNKPLYFTVYVEDISEPKRVNAALSESEGRFRIMADSCPSMMWVIDSAGEVQFVNRAYRAFCGIQEGEVDRSRWDCLICPADAPEYTAALQRALVERTTFRVEARVQIRSGDWRLIGSTAEPYISPEGEYLGHIGLSADITKRVQNEKDREFELSLFRSIQDEMLEGILVVDESRRISSINRRFLEIWPATGQAGCGGDFDRAAGALDDPLLVTVLTLVEEPDSFRRRIEELYTHPDEKDHCEIRLKDGRTIERHSTGLRNKDDKYLGRVWFFRDITSRKLAEINVRAAKESAEEANRELSAQRVALESERQILHALIDNVPDFMYVKDVESRFLVANTHLARVMGARSPQELRGKTDFDYFAPELAQRYFEDEQALLKSGRPLYNQEESCIDENGRAIQILTTKVPVRDSDGKLVGIAGVGRNISIRKRMENALREAEQKYRGIFDNAIVGIFQSTPEGRFLSANPSMAAMFGYDSPEEMVWLITDIAHQFYADPKHREDFKARIATNGGVHNFECEALRRDGTKVWLSMSVRGISQDGQLVRYEGMCEDITERKLLRAQLLQAQKLESVGQLAAGIAHEINTPIQFIGDNVLFVKDAFFAIKELWEKFHNLAAAVKESGCHRDAVDEITATMERVDAAFLIEEIPKAIDQAVEGITRVSTLVSAMKEFSHPGTKEKVPIDLNHAIESTITVSRNEWRHVAELETEFDRSLQHVPCLPAEFNQVILNLIVNAAHAITDVTHSGDSKKGRIWIQTRNLKTCAEIRIQDTGTGIPEEIRGRVFDPFFTTKGIGKGTGQGLAIAHSVVVDKHGGTIQFETEEGKGTTFIIRLPYGGGGVALEGAVRR